MSQQFMSFLPYTGRGVRFRLLNPSERDKVLVDAAKLTSGADASYFEMRTIESRLGVKAMLQAITAKDGLTEDDLLKPDTKWTKLSVQIIDDKYDVMFADPREHQALTALFRHYHDVGLDEVKGIVGKTLPVSQET